MVVRPHAANAQLDHGSYIEEPTSGGILYMTTLFLKSIHNSKAFRKFKCCNQITVTIFH